MSIGAPPIDLLGPQGKDLSLGHTHWMSFLPGGPLEPRAGGQRKRPYRAASLDCLKCTRSDPVTRIATDGLAVGDLVSIRGLNQGIMKHIKRFRGANPSGRHIHFYGTFSDHR